MNHHEDDSIFRVRAASDEFVRLARQRGWPDGLLDRMMALRLPSWLIAESLSDAYAGAVGLLEANVSDRERLSSGLVVREATWEDDERIRELFSNATERLDDWDVVVERGPNPFAQQRVQEGAHIKVLVDRGAALGVSVQSTRNTVVGGRRVSVAWMGGWRIRDGLRRNRYSTLLLNTPCSASGLIGVVTYWYVRVSNSTAQSWIANAVATAERESPYAPERRTAIVHHLLGEIADLDTPKTTNVHLRPVEHGDLQHCAELINRTHDGLDLLRPYTTDFLESRLDDGYWGLRPDSAPRVYGWEDMVVAERCGRIVACGGGWDRGRDVRERWRHRTTGERRTVDNVCLMDWGYAVGEEAAMVEVVRHHLHRARVLGRTTLAVPFQQHPEMLNLVEWARPEPEIRVVEALVTTPCGTNVDATLIRPFTDLAYW